MKRIVLLLFAMSCAHKVQQIESDNFVSIYAALNQAQASYLKGCIDGMKQFNAKGVFVSCKEKAIIHRQEINFIMDQDL